MTIWQATINDLSQLSILFAQYRVFYEQPFEITKFRWGKALKMILSNNILMEE